MKCNQMIKGDGRKPEFMKCERENQVKASEQDVLDLRPVEWKRSRQMRRSQFIQLLCLVDRLHGKAINRMICGDHRTAGGRTGI